MTSVCTCDTYPTVGTDDSAGSCFIDATSPSGFARVLFKSSITSDGAAFRIALSATSAERANVTATPIRLAVVLILDVNIKSSRTAKIMA
jgi:hypothetical protein